MNNTANTLYTAAVMADYVRLPEPAEPVVVRGRGLGDALGKLDDAYRQVRDAMTPLEKADKQARDDRALWLAMQKNSGPSGEPAGTRTCMRCGRDRPHNKNAGLCRDCTAHLKSILSIRRSGARAHK